MTTAGRFGTYNAVFGVCYLGLAVNALLAVANAPLLIALGTTAHPLRAWPAMAMLTLGVGPSLAAALACFHRHGENGSASPVRDFLAGYRAHARRALVCWGGALGLTAVLVTDLFWARERAVGALLAPVFAVLVVVTAAATLNLLVMVVRRPDAPLPALARAALFLSLRRWYASLLNLVLLAGVVAGIAVRPALGLLLMPSFALYVIWSNGSYALERAVEEFGGR